MPLLVTGLTRFSVSLRSSVSRFGRLCVSIFFLSLFSYFERERAHMWVGDRQKKMGRKNPKQAPHCQHGAQYRAQSRNCEIMTWAKIKGWIPSWLSHAGTHNFFFQFIQVIQCFGIQLFLVFSYNLFYLYRIGINGLSFISNFSYLDLFSFYFYSQSNQKLWVFKNLFEELTLGFIYLFAFVFSIFFCLCFNLYCFLPSAYLNLICYLRSRFCFQWNWRKV